MWAYNCWLKHAGNYQIRRIIFWSLTKKSKIKLVMLRNVLSLLPGWKSTSGIIQLWVHFIPKCPEVFVRLAVGNTASQKACFDFQSDADSVCLICHNDLSQGTGGTTELQCSHSFHKEVTHTHTHTDISGTVSMFWLLYRIKRKMQPALLSVSSVHPGVAVEETVLSYLSPPGVHATARLLELHSCQSPLKASRDSTVGCFKRERNIAHSRN